MPNITINTFGTEENKKKGDLKIQVNTTIK